jgi:hypothetical protein
MKLDFSRQIFEKSSNMKFYEKMASGNRIVPCGQTDEEKNRQTDRRTDMMKLIVAFRKFANAPNKQAIILTEQILNLTQFTFLAIDLLYGANKIHIQ